MIIKFTNMLVLQLILILGLVLIEFLVPVARASVSPLPLLKVPRIEEHFLRQLQLTGLVELPAK